MQNTCFKFAKQHTVFLARYNTQFSTTKREKRNERQTLLNAHEVSLTKPSRLTQMIQHNNTLNRTQSNVKHLFQICKLNNKLFLRRNIQWFYYPSDSIQTNSIVFFYLFLTITHSLLDAVSRVKSNPSAFNHTKKTNEAISIKSQLVYFSILYKRKNRLTLR